MKTHHSIDGFVFSMNRNRGHITVSVNLFLRDLNGVFSYKFGKFKTFSGLEIKVGFTLYTTWKKANHKKHEL